tara:strand:- start:123 stop:311 length:189 start_codon:yes stop_codon:yes gene_type:complete
MWSKEAWKEHDMIDKEKKEPTVTYFTDEFGVTHIIDLEKKEDGVERYLKKKIDDDDIDKFGE